METIIRGRYLIRDASIGEAGVEQNAAVFVKDDIIVDTGSFLEIRDEHPDAVIIGNDHQLVMPGLIDAHTHGRGLSFLQRGIGYDFLENSLLDWAFAIDLPAELNAQLTTVRHLRNGCTMLHHNEMGRVNDPDAFHKAAAAIQVYRGMGIRSAYSPGIRDINFLAYDDEAFYASLPDELKKFAFPLVFFDKEKARQNYFELFERLYAEFNNGTSSVFPGPSWAHGASDEYLTRVKQRADELGGLPIHIHTLQTAHQRAYGMRKYGKSLLMHLDDLGLVDEHLTLGHAVYVDEADIALLARNQASITHHPSCNFAMRNGIAPVYFMQRAGVNVAMGMDEKAFNDDEDAVSELRMIYYVNRLSDFDLGNTPALSPYQVLAMGTCNAARCLGLGNRIGRLIPGMKADLITLDLKEMMEDPWVAPDLDICKMFIHRGRGRHVKNVIIDGKLVVDEGVIKTVDIDTLYKEVRDFASRGQTPVQRAYAEGLKSIKPYLHNWYRGLGDFPRDPFYKVNSRS